MTGHIPVFHLACPCSPKQIPIHSNSTPFRSYPIQFTFPMYQEIHFPPPHPTTTITTNILFEFQVLFTVMVPNSKKAEVGENPFLPPPVDLDKIPLSDKDHLISNTRCEVDFVDLQSWLNDTFLDQSDEIRLWESNLPLYIFPQVHHFPEFSLKF
jgi:hypothetical protein